MRFFESTLIAGLAVISTYLGVNLYGAHKCDDVVTVFGLFFMCVAVGCIALIYDLYHKDKQ